MADEKAPDRKTIGDGRMKRMLTLLRRRWGWPLALLAILFYGVLAWRYRLVLWRVVSQPIGLVILFVFAVVAAALRLLPKWQVNGVRDDEKKRIELEINARTSLAQIFGGALLLVGLFLSWNTVELSREGHITDRLTHAVDQLGSVRPDGQPNLEVRIGGILALERIGRDSQRDSWTVVEILSAYVRNNSPWKEGDEEPPVGFRPRVDIQAAVTAIGRRPWEKSESERQVVDLSKTDLRAADLTGANLARANLSSSHFCRANLTSACLDDADLSYANFQTARLDYASIRIREQASLMKAEFYGSDLGDADLRGSQFFESSFRNANMHRSHLEGTSTSWEVDFGGAVIIGAHVEGADFRGTKGLTKQQLKLAYLDAATKCPPGEDPRGDPNFEEVQKTMRDKFSQWRRMYPRVRPIPTASPTR
jgi:uncharacterized protein YjbI with pentapeptide repeats